jgi:hypothetical protein
VPGKPVPTKPRGENALRRAIVATAAVVTVLAVPSAHAWAPAASAPIHPGVMTFTNGAQCTANFVYTAGSTVYIGQAAHCSSTGAPNETNGCTTGSLPIGTQVDVDGANHPGVMAYNSWLTMQQVGETDPDTCAFNDLALVRLDPADAANVNPSIPFWGGPTGMRGGTSTLQTVLSYGNSELRLGIAALSPKQGVSLGKTNGDWTQSVYTVTPGIPGDSGSAFISGQGNAVGVLSTVAVLPLPASNGVGTLSKELGYASAHGFGVSLALGTEPFRGPLP